MNSQPALLRLSLPVPAFRNGALYFATPAQRLKLFSGVCACGAARRKQPDIEVPYSRWNTISRPRAMKDMLQNGILEIKQLDTLSEGYNDKCQAVTKELESQQKIDAVKAMLRSMEDGEISVSAYATAWVSLVDDIHGSSGPQFPTSLQWIADNQLSDGSWGDGRVFSAYDRMINTLACVIALKYWNIYPESCKKGLSFLRENLRKLEDEDAEHMTIGFEVAFPSLIEMARSLDLEFPYDSSILQDIYAKRNLKLTRISKEIMHNVPTTLLFSLEGMPDLDWEKLLKLQSADGSFLCSPSSTAFALKQTKDEKCLKYLKKIVEKFNGGVPNVYPVDLFEHIWAVDRLERLGICRYFEKEIKDCMDYVYRYWTDEGICWARNSRLPDADDTAMGFRLLRLHGYPVSADIFRHFMNGGEFFTCAGQLNESVTTVFNLNRASQISFPGEEILEQARSFSYKFLREKQASKQLQDKWIITKDLPGEVRYALEFPWYASLPGVETRFYLEQYGGEDDVWIGKTLYRMHHVNNSVYLELAKLDFNRCQGLHQLELLKIQKWCFESNLMEFGPSQEMIVRAYFLAAASIFEPEKATERLAWAITAVLIEAVSSYFGADTCTDEKRAAFLRDFCDLRSDSKITGKGLVGSLNETLCHLSHDTLLAHGSNVRGHLHCAWEDWLLKWQQGYGDNGLFLAGEAELLVRTINLCAGRMVSEEILAHPQYVHLACQTNWICDRLRQVRELKRSNSNGAIAVSGLISNPIESEMQKLVQCLLERSSDSIDHDIKQTFLAVAKSFYYAAHCPPATLDFHMAKVLFERAA